MKSTEVYILPTLYVHLRTVGTLPHVFFTEGCRLTELPPFRMSPVPKTVANYSLAPDGAQDTAPQNMAPQNMAHWHTILG